MVIRALHLVFPLTCALGLALGCSDPGDGGRDPGSHQAPLNVIIASADAVVPSSTGQAGLGLSRRALDREGVVTCDLGRGESGVCLRPLNVRGWTGNVNLGGRPRTPRPTRPDGTPEPSVCGPGRLLVIDTVTDSGGPARSGGVFDLSNPTPVGGNTALFCEEHLDTVWDRVSLEMTYVDVQVEMITDVWTLRYVFEPNPLNADPIFADPTCAMDPHYMAQLSYLPDDVVVQRGDVLLCRKSSPGEPCEDKDFEWLDTDSMTFTSTRPAEAHQLAYFEHLSTGRQPDGTWGEVFCNTDCVDGDAYCGFDAGGFAMSFNMGADRAFMLYSEEIDHTDPRHPAYGTDTSSDSDALARRDIYHFEDAGGAVVEGFAEDLQVVLRLSLDELLVLPGLRDTGEVEDYTDAELFEMLVPKGFATEDFGLTGWVEVGFR